MGDLAQDTAVSAVAGQPEGGRRFTATVHEDWEIWGPAGGYVAAIALRAAGAVSPFERPASFYCHYLSVAAFEPVELVVTPLRAGRTVLAQRVAMSQHGRPVLEAMVWSVGEVAGLVHRDLEPPEVPDPSDLKSPEELWSDREGPRFRFWNNFDQRPIDYEESWPPPGPLPPTWRTWLRCRPTPTFDDPWVDAARTLVVLDVLSWPAGSRPHAYLEPPFTAPSLDLYASFQNPGSSTDWLLLHGHSPVAGDGLLSWTGRVWTRDRQLIASGGGQAVFRHT
ncbi:MAG TPA: thioesterase family protein [Acidimicrobiales bacterium]|nr:thioesterase family protein [Acidimicrobiales bacterium]